MYHERHTHRNAHSDPHSRPAVRRYLHPANPIRTIVIIILLYDLHTKELSVTGGSSSLEREKKEGRWARYYSITTNLFSHNAHPLSEAHSLVGSVLNKQCLRPEFQARFAVFSNDVEMGNSYASNALC